MTDFNQQLKLWEGQQEQDYQDRMAATDLDEWLEEMSPEERADYERRKEEREGF